jgi:ATP-binding cassette subfamily C protein
LRARNALLGLTLLSALSNVLALTGSLYMLQVYDRVLPSGSVPTLVALSLLAAGLFVFYGLLDLVRGRVLVRLGAWFDASVSRHIYRVIVRLPLSRMADVGKVDPLRDLDAVRSFVSSQAPCAIFDLPWVPFYLGLIYLLHPWLAVLALGGIILLVALMIATAAGTQKATEAASKAWAERMRIAETSRRNAEPLTALGIAHRYAARWSAVNESYMAAQQDVADLGGGYGAASRTLRMMLQSAVLGLGAYLVISQEASAGLIIAASIISGRALAPLDLAIPNWKNWSAARQSWKRLSRLLKTFPQSNEKLALRPPKKCLEVTASAVPPGSTQVVVHDASFRLEAGQGLGIIGPSASGKSSLARLLVGVWSPVRGAVRLDGASIDQWTSEDLGRHLGYLPQTVELLPGTISENIARFDPDADPEAVIRAAEMAGVHELIVNLPEGYQTAIGEYGAGLSAGQQQRIALARALYGDPFLVVLDEPNSNLDGEGEAALTRAILGVRQRGGMAVVVAHHPAALAGVDTLLVMGQGRVQVFGPKEEVLPKVLRPVASAPLKPVAEAAEVRS